jgi:peptidylprolyl isomerase
MTRSFRAWAMTGLLIVLLITASCGRDRAVEQVPAASAVTPTEASAVAPNEPADPEPTPTPQDTESAEVAPAGLPHAETAPTAPAAPSAVDEAGYAVFDNGLKTYDLVVGDGPAPMPGQVIVVHYTGWLLGGEQFVSSLEYGEPYAFNLGMGQVIGGWDLGLIGMKAGGKRQLVIPPALAYGEEGMDDVIPPNVTVVFEVELLEVR